MEHLKFQNKHFSTDYKTNYNRNIQFVETLNMKASACHILVKTLQEAEKIKVLLDKGGSFQQLAKKHSTCPSGKKGGDLGEFRPGSMVKAFDNIVFNKEILTVHGPIKTQFGYHLIKTLYRG
jgi:peptidyl-prolyl cis-trans isomerase C